MLLFADVSLTIIHLAILLFNLFGWVHPRTRKLHFIVVLITAFCWLVLGQWKGIGYCPITDLQWHIKAQLGYQNIPHSFVTWCLYNIGLTQIPESAISAGTGIGFAIAGTLAIYFNVVKRIGSWKKNNVTRF